MRQAVEAQVLNPHCELGEQGLRQILTDVIEEVRRSIHQDIDGADILHSLLNSPWLHSLLKVYECLQRHLRNSPQPALDYASGLALQLLIDIRSLQDCSEEAKELYRLLRQPHLQALLSAHDTVAQKDYEPILPPMPDDIPDDEEATRIVCLVKNKQPLLCPQQRPASKFSCGAMHSHWDTLRHLTRQKFNNRGVPAAATSTSNVKETSWCSFRRGSYPPTDVLCCPEAARSHDPPQCKPARTCHMCCSKPVSKCRVCYTDLLWERSVNRSAPSVYSSVMIDNIIEELENGDEDQAGDSMSPLPIHTPRTFRRWTMSPPCLTVPCYSPRDDYHQPSFPPHLRCQSPRIRTAPPSPMYPRRVSEIPPVELAKQESLDELRSTVQLAASSMESSTKDIKLLGVKMAVATERMSETVQDNSQALVLLTQVVNQLQTLLTTKCAAADQDPTKSCRSPKGRHKRPSLTHQSGFSLPSLPSSSSSSSLSSCLDVPSTSQWLSVSYQGSPQTTVKNKNTKLKKHTDKFHAPEHPLTNGLLDKPKESPQTVRKGRSSQRKKNNKKKKKSSQKAS